MNENEAREYAAALAEVLNPGEMRRRKRLRAKTLREAENLVRQRQRRYAEKRLRYYSVVNWATCTTALKVLAVVIDELARLATEAEREAER